MPKDQIDIELDALEASFGADGYEDVPQGGSGEMLVVSETETAPAPGFIASVENKIDNNGAMIAGAGFALIGILALLRK
tara:strand:+ start:1151 stop:1387 length:237 start_codon:yes stop_codon:yes gene_type:complete